MKKQILVGILTLLVLPILAQARTPLPVGFHEMECRQLNGPIDAELGVNVDWIQRGNTNGYYLATVSRHSIRGLIVLGRFQVTKKISSRNGGPIRYFGPDFDLIVKPAASPVAGGMPGHLDVDTRMGRYSDDMTCHFVR